MDQQQPRPGQQPSSTPSGSDSQRSILGDLLNTLGVGQQHIDVVHQSAQNADVNQQLDKAHSYVTDVINQARQHAQKNPAAVLGGLSALVIAAGMLKNNMRR